MGKQQINKKSKWVVDLTVSSNLQMMERTVTGLKGVHVPVQKKIIRRVHKIIHIFLLFRMTNILRGDAEKKHPNLKSP